ncbi:hypothetical protein I316_05152 [Kwoniella heveanensis BCC8398]|uniref:Uncharacterized protein n=1 Tax=Kwoniella heveanensis BCC8398 TaxID=1296120 RepID=A0A1B9GQ21_9TREE|nr:hypothetical protein I316_05152 [Kwoniella heveanensis BCC8398]
MSEHSDRCSFIDGRGHPTTHSGGRNDADRDISGPRAFYVPLYTDENADPIEAHQQAHLSGIADMFCSMNSRGMMVGQLVITNTQGGTCSIDPPSEGNCPYRDCSSFVTVEAGSGGEDDDAHDDTDSVDQVIGDVRRTMHTADLERSISPSLCSRQPVTERWLNTKYLGFQTQKIPLSGTITHPATHFNSPPHPTDETQRTTRPERTIQGTAMALHTVMVPELTVPSNDPRRDLLSCFSEVGLKLEGTEDRVERLNEILGLSHGHSTVPDGSIPVNLYTRQRAGAQLGLGFRLNHGPNVGAFQQNSRLHFVRDDSVLRDEEDHWAMDAMHELYGGEEGLTVTCLTTLLVKGKVQSSSAVRPNQGEAGQRSFPVSVWTDGGLGLPKALTQFLDLTPDRGVSETSTPVRELSSTSSPPPSTLPDAGRLQRIGYMRQLLPTDTSWQTQLDIRPGPLPRSNDSIRGHGRTTQTQAATSTAQPSLTSHISRTRQSSSEHHVGNSEAASPSTLAPTSEQSQQTVQDFGVFQP